MNFLIVKRGGLLKRLLVIEEVEILILEGHLEGNVFEEGIYFALRGAVGLILALEDSDRYELEDLGVIRTSNLHLVSVHQAVELIYPVQLDLFLIRRSETISTYFQGEGVLAFLNI